MTLVVLLLLLIYEIPVVVMIVFVMFSLCNKISCYFQLNTIFCCWFYFLKSLYDSAQDFFFKTFVVTGALVEGVTKI